MPLAAKTDILRREDRVQKAEAKLPANMDDVLAQMNGGLGVQQATHALDGEDKRNTDFLETASKVANILTSQAGAEVPKGSRKMRMRTDQTCEVVVQLNKKFILNLYQSKRSSD